MSKKDSECISTRIAAATKRVPYDVGISWAMLRDTFLVNPGLLSSFDVCSLQNTSFFKFALCKWHRAIVVTDGFNELNFDQTENPAGFSVTGFRSVRWSPIGCDEVGRFVFIVFAFY